MLSRRYSEAKKQRLPLKLYSSELRRNLRSRNKVAAKDLANAIKYHQLSLVYQPIWDIDTNRVVKLEAAGSLATPSAVPFRRSEFIPLAEESGLIQGWGGGFCVPAPIW